MSPLLPSPRGGARRGGGFRPIGEINVTPLVDVMLVLLIVFMISAPLLAVGVPVELPRGESPPLARQPDPVAVTLDSEGRLFVGEEEISADAFGDKMRSLKASGYDRPIYLRIDRRVLYGEAMFAMGAISSAGLEKIALVADPRGGERDLDERVVVERP